jgi:hypothetical protein
MQQWEYARILVDRGDVSVTYSHQDPAKQGWARVIFALHDLGDEGWELVTASNRDGNEILHLKRPLQSSVAG